MPERCAASVNTATVTTLVCEIAHEATRTMRLHVRSEFKNPHFGSTQNRVASPPLRAANAAYIVGFAHVAFRPTLPASLTARARPQTSKSLEELK